MEDKKEKTKDEKRPSPPGAQEKEYERCVECGWYVYFCECGVSPLTPPKKRVMALCGTCNTTMNMYEGCKNPACDLKGGAIDTGRCYEESEVEIKSQEQVQIDELKERVEELEERFEESQNNLVRLLNLLDKWTSDDKYSFFKVK